MMVGKLREGEGRVPSGVLWVSIADDVELNFSFGRF